MLDRFKGIGQTKKSSLHPPYWKLGILNSAKMYVRKLLYMIPKFLQEHRPQGVKGKAIPVMCHGGKYGLKS
jgi:hypothetical protein